MGTALSGTSSEGPFSRRGGTLDPIKFDGNVASVRHFTPLNLMGTRHMGWKGSTQCKRKLLTQKSAVAGEREAPLDSEKGLAIVTDQGSRTFHIANPSHTHTESLAGPLPQR